MWTELKIQAATSRLWGQNCSYNIGYGVAGAWHSAWHVVGPQTWFVNGWRRQNGRCGWTKFGLWSKEPRKESGFCIFNKDMTRIEGIQNRTENLTGYLLWWDQKYQLPLKETRIIFSCSRILSWRLSQETYCVMQFSKRRKLLPF